ncbi:uncharacterized protein LOC120328499 [Styela clava]
MASRTTNSSLLYIVAITLFVSIVAAQEGTSTILTENINDASCGVQIDLIILVDGSKSVKPENFLLVKAWIKDLAKGFNIDSGSVQIGVVQYSYWYPRRPMWRQRYIKTEISLGRYRKLSSFSRAVDRIRYQGYQTFTAHAINKTVDYDFQSRYSRYPEAQRVIILLTDGRATDEADLPLAIEHAEKDAGVMIFAVGVGEYSLEELQLFTHNDRKRIFELKNFGELHNIVYELSLLLQEACDCNVLGSLTADCDVCTRECVCKPNVVGRRCDQCAPGHYNISHSAGCTACKCHPLGTEQNFQCDFNTGECNCKRGVVGEECNKCEDGWSGFPECMKCNCNGFSTSCDEDTGYCINCSNYRAGKTCQTCISGYYILESGNCVPCNCNGNIDINDPESCDANTGECLRCLHGTAGHNCENCDTYYYRNVESGICESCECDIKGIDPSMCADGKCSCDKETAQCECLPNVTGISCQACAETFWGFDSVEGCQSCECNGLGSFSQSCNDINGECECLPGYSGIKCELCDKGYFRINEFDTCKACFCNMEGTEISTCVDDACTCDQFSGQCSCYPHVVGISCNQCEDGYWNLQAFGGCETCDCHKQGSNSSTCDKFTGQCECLPGHAGLKCELCERGHSKLNEEDLCISCDCDVNGTSSLACINEVCSCDDSNGQCPCRPNVVGSSCHECADMFWGFGSEKGCKSCDCNWLGAISLSCDVNTGVCECLPGYSGTKCENCISGYFGDDCRECECSEVGTDKSTCDEDFCTCDASGQCSCLPHVIGRSCEECEDGYWNITSGEGCVPCACHKAGSSSNVCNKQTGECDCLPGHSGIKCQKCNQGYSREDSASPCVECDCNIKGTNSSSCDDGSCSCDATTGQCSCLPNVMGLLCDECNDGYWDFESKSGCRKCGCHKLGSLSPSCDKNTGICECLPGHLGTNCDQCDSGYHRKNMRDECKACKCNTFGTNPVTCVDDVCGCDSFSGQCNCLPNVIGLSCDKCDDGFWNLGSEIGCVNCSCHVEGTRDPACDKVTGVCVCHPGHTGEKCEKCDRGYFRLNSNERCKECKCNLYGTNPASCSNGVCTCDATTGQCNCLPNIDGKSCDKCDEGFWNIRSMTGCKACRCHLKGSTSRNCEEKSGQCQCVVGHVGQRCEECDKEYGRTNPQARCEDASINDEPTDEPPRTEISTARTKSPSTQATTTRATRAPYIPVTTTKRTFVNRGCGGCSGNWPSYCHGWMCRRRWPYSQFKPSQRRCNYGHMTCQYNVASTHGRFGANNYNARSTASPTKRPGPAYGYRLYGSTNYYLPYSGRRTRTHTRTRSSQRSSGRSLAYGLYRRLYGGKK